MPTLTIFLMSYATPQVNIKIMPRNIEYTVQNCDGSKEIIITSEYNNVVQALEHRECLVPTDVPQTVNDYAQLLGGRKKNISDETLGRCVRRGWRMLLEVRSGLIPVGSRVAYVLNPDIPHRKEEFPRGLFRYPTVISARYLDDGTPGPAHQNIGGLEHSLAEMQCPPEPPEEQDSIGIKNSLIDTPAPTLPPEVPPILPSRRATGKYKQGGVFKIPDIE